jgi:hypothetical protein
MEYTAPVLGHVGVETQRGGREVEDWIMVEDGPRDTRRKREAEGRVDEHYAHRWWQTLRKRKEEEKRVKINCGIGPGRSVVRTSAIARKVIPATRLPPAESPTTTTRSAAFESSAQHVKHRGEGDEYRRDCQSGKGRGEGVLDTMPSSR